MKLYTLAAIVSSVGLKRTILVMTIITALVVAFFLVRYLIAQWRAK